MQSAVRVEQVSRLTGCANHITLFPGTLTKAVLVAVNLTTAASYNFK
jgi:hypothetical protein